jgi:putative peptidoglycan lipid II flippase
MVPRSLGVGVNQVGVLVMTVFASFLASGTLAAFSFANNIQSVVLGLFGVAFSVAAFPTLSGLIAEKNGKDFFRTVADTTRRILFFVLPISALLIIFRAHFVRLILGTGEFSWEDTTLTFEALGWLSLSLFAQSLIPLFSRAFFAMRDTKTPLFIALASETVHILVLAGLFSAGTLSVAGLAISFSVTSIMNAGLLYIYLRRFSAHWDDGKIFAPAVKIVLAAFLAGVVAQLSKSLFDLTATELDTFLTVFLQLALGSTIGGVAYVFLCNALRVEELSLLKRYILCKILRQPEAAAAVERGEKTEW